MKIQLFGTESGLDTRQSQLAAAVISAHEKTLRLQFTMTAMFSMMINVGTVVGARMPKVTLEERDMETFLVEEMRAFVRVAFPDLRIQIEPEPSGA